MSGFDAALRLRAEGRCELCGNDERLLAVDVPPTDEPQLDRSVLICTRCDEQRTDPTANPSHWNCLRESVWSGVPVVQVVSYRLLSELAEEGWAQELLGQVYLEPETLEWAQQGVAGGGDDDEAAPTLDSNGTVLLDGDSVSIIKDLDAKGAGFVAKRGTVVKNIRLTGDPGNIEGRVNKTVLVLKTKFLKKI